MSFLEVRRRGEKERKVEEGEEMEALPDEREPGMNWSLERMIVPILSDFVLAYANFLQECARRKMIKRRNGWITANGTW